MVLVRYIILLLFIQPHLY